MYFENGFFMRVVRNQNQGYVSRKCISWQISEEIGIVMFYLHIFLTIMHEIDPAGKVHLEPFQKYIWLRIFAKMVTAFAS